MTAGGGQIFRKELLIRFTYFKRWACDFNKFKGGMGWRIRHSAIFLPSSWQKYAVMYNGDGHKIFGPMWMMP